MKNKIFNENGITLIALIITVIVMLILVGVTITVALNGGLFDTTQKAAKGTQKDIERERLTEVALASYNVSESKISDVDSLVGKLSGMGFSKDESKSSVSNAKLVVQGKDTLWQIDLATAEVKPYKETETYTFTVGELGRQQLLPSDVSGAITIPASSFWRSDASDNIKNSFVDVVGLPGAKKYNITCSDSSYTECGLILVDTKGYSIFADSNYNISFMMVGENGESINNDNYQPYADLAFTISMPE